MKLKWEALDSQNSDPCLSQQEGRECGEASRKEQLNVRIFAFSLPK